MSWTISHVAWRFVLHYIFCSFLIESPYVVEFSDWLREVDALGTAAHAFELGRCVARAVSVVGACAAGADVAPGLFRALRLGIVLGSARCAGSSLHASVEHQLKHQWYGIPSLF
jgi:hypothetical protein